LGEAHRGEKRRFAKVAAGQCMELDNLSPSGIRRIADYSPYLDQLAGLAQQMGLRQRSNLVHLEKCLHSHWSLGQNNILSWSPLDEGVMILVVPHYAVAEYTTPRANGLPPRLSPRFITELISGDRQLSIPQMEKVARQCMCRYGNRWRVTRSRR